MSHDVRFYVYAILVDGIVRYIGKGTGRRSGDHVRIARAVLERRVQGNRVRTVKFYNRLAKALAAGCFVEGVILVGSLNEAEAFEREKQEIAAAPEGQLWNTLDGGQGWSSENARRMAHETWAREDVKAKRLAGLEKLNSEFWADPEQKARRNLAATAAQPKATEQRWGRRESREKYSGQMRAYWSSPEARAKGSEAGKARWRDPAYLEKMKNRKRPVLSPEARQRMREARKAYWQRKRDDLHRASVASGSSP